MEKRMFPEVRKKRPIKRNKKKLLNKVLDYLTTDSYMFAPLVSRPPSGFNSSVKKKASLRGVEVKTPVRENKRLLEKLSDYLKSNCYMYAPLLNPPQSIIPPKGSSLDLGRVTTVGALERRLILRGYKPNEKLADAIVEDQASKGSLPEEIMSKQRSSVHKETVKQVVRNSCRSSSMSGKAMLGSQIRKLVD
ncbi:hypothetical protein M0R45_001870 [Rubus argutus]|uniref:Uncharacterized protein n=1 Tax=Rubus argutus TaxID=59490 RepID=A0AAW1VL09_RUBAR